MAHFLDLFFVSNEPIPTGKRPVRGAHASIGSSNRPIRLHMDDFDRVQRARDDAGVGGLDPASRVGGRARTIVYFASQEALGPMTDVLLSRLGYEMLSPELFERVRHERPGTRIEMFVVDERRVADLDAFSQARLGAAVDEATDELPVLLLTGRNGVVEADSRIVGAVKRPAGIHELFRLMQQVFEDTPRSTPRVTTSLAARCRARDRVFEGRVVSLSENGCLLESEGEIPLGSRLDLELSLPGEAALALRGDATYQLLPDTGLVFHGIEPRSRDTLGRYIAQALVAG